MIAKIKIMNTSITTYSYLFCGGFWCGENTQDLLSVNFKYTILSYCIITYSHQAE